MQDSVKQQAQEAALATVVTFIVLPIASIAAGYFIGKLLDSIFYLAGNWVVSGANAISIDITREQLPEIGALLGFISAFFRRE